MPTYNQAEFIKEAIDSILAQTFKDFELIIVNDGSTDGTKNVIEQYLFSDKRVRMVDKKNEGTGTALNSGFAIAQGEYETWFASDNKMYPNCLEVLVNYLDKNPSVDHAYAAIDYAMMAPDGLTPIWTKHISKILDQTWDKERFFRNYFLGCSWLWRKELRLRCGDGLFQKEPCEDYDMAMRMVEAGGNFAFCNETLAWYRQHGKNISHTLASHQYYKDVVAKAERRRMGKVEAPRINTNHMKIAIVNLEFDCAGVGWALSQAVNRLTDHKAIHITKTIYPFAPDTDYRIDLSNIEELKRKLEWADILHFNQWIWTHNPNTDQPFRWTPFNDTPIIDFYELFKTKRVFFHYHSGEVLAEPSYWLRECKKVNAKIFTCDPPTELVVEGAKWMPNILDVKKFHVTQLKEGYPIKAYSGHGLNDDRKNVSLYKRWMDQMARCGFVIPYEIIWGHKKEASYLLRKNCHVALESMTEGYIGMVGWEALAMGHAVIARLGEYTRKRYADLGEGIPPPIQHAESPQMVTQLLRDMFNARPALQRLMQDGRNWMEKYYDPKRIVKMYIDEYKKG